MVDGMDVIKEVHEVLDQIKTFTEGVRSGELRGYTGKRLRNIVSVGIGGSYLGPEFLHECLKTEPEGINAALGYSLRFLSNVDPVEAIVDMNDGGVHYAFEVLGRKQTCEQADNRPAIPQSTDL